MKNIGHLTLLLISILGTTWSCTQMRESTQFMEIRGLNGAIRKIDIKAIEALRRKIQGRFFLKESEDYDHAREIWNLARHDLQPALIIQCVDKSDVAVTVDFAREHGLLLSVKGGGHNSAGYALNDNGIVIDLSGMKTIKIDPEKRTAVVGAGVTWGELDKATQKYELATTGAIVSQVGVGGFTLGGGLGWLHRSLGAASDNLISANIITADGTAKRISSEHHQDLFWAIRGGGGNFGVITSFEFKLHPVEPQILAGLVFYPFKDLKKVVSFYRDYITDIPDELGTWLLFRKAPPIDALPREVHGEPVAIIAITYNGPLQEGLAISKPLREITKPIADLVKSRSYVDWQSSLDGAWGDGFHNLWSGHYFMEINDQMIDSLQYYVPKGSPFSDIKIQHLEGQFGRIPDSQSAFGNRQAKFGMVIQTRWQDAQQTSQQEEWARKVHKALNDPSTGKVYVNFIDDKGPERVKDAYSQTTYSRLQAIKRKYDPHNLFRRNQNIPPK